MRVSKRFLFSLFGSVAWWSGVALSLTLYLMVSQTVTEKVEAQFEHSANHANLAIQGRVRSYVEVLRGVRALFYSSNDVSRAQFNAYVSQLNVGQHFPGIESLNFAPRVLSHERIAFEQSIRSDTSINPAGYPDFAIKPAGERAEYHVLAYLEPMEQRVFGRDMGAIPWASNALSAARDSGQVMSSGKVIRIKGAEETVGLAIRMPVYRTGMPVESIEERRAAYYGSVGAGFNINTLMHGAVDEATLRTMRVRLFDTGQANQDWAPGTDDPERMLFDSGPVQGGAANGAAGTLVKRVALTIGPRVWEAEFSSRHASMTHGLDVYLPWIVLILGLTGTTLLYSNYYSLITARRRATELAQEMTQDLRASEANLAQTQHMARLGSWTLDFDGNRMSWSAETYRLLGIDRARSPLSYDDFLERVHPEDRDAVQAGLAHTLETGEDLALEHRIQTSSNVVRWVHCIARRSRDDLPVLRGAMRDITERKQAVEALKRSQELLRDLTAHQDRVKEDERKRIAREIHDELGQTLLALRIDVSMLDARTGKSHPRLNEKVRGALAQIDSTVRTIRNIINNLRPSVLDLGLTAAIEWQVGQFRRRTSIACELIMGEAELRVDDARATSLFRILQESLTNVVRHANASKVTVEVRQENERLVMRITDNGVGIYPGDRRSNSFGLVGVEERVNALGGEFYIRSARGEGTTLTIHIPLDANETPLTGLGLADKE